MKIIIVPLQIILCLLFAFNAYGKEDCNKKCCTTKKGRAFGIPYSATVCEPTCKSLCEASNAVEPHLPKIGGELGAAHGKVKEAVHKGVKETGHGLADLERTARTGKCGGDLCDTLAKAAGDTAKEAERAKDNIEDAGQAIGHYVENQVHGVGETLTDAEKRFRSGKAIDALWHLSTDSFRKTEEYTAQAVQESSILNTIGQVAASAYGGPQGAAAYASWYTYRETCKVKCDIEMAVRVGVITGATSTAFGAASKMPSDTAGQIAKKALVAGAIGGTAVAASGGDANAVREGFLRAGGMVLIRDGYKNITEHDLDARGSTGDAYCIQADPDSNLGCLPPKDSYYRDENGNILDENNNLWKKENGVPPKVDVLKTNARYSHVGIADKTEANTWQNMSGETGKPMKLVSRIPGMNAMALFHDKWAFDWDMGPTATKATILPAIVLTYYGTGAPAYNLIQKANVLSSLSNKQKNFSKMDVSVSIGAPSPDTKRFQDTVSASFLCSHGKKMRQIVVDAPSQTPGYACRVIYQSEKGISIPWYARNEEKYCRPKATYLVAKQIGWGWSCYAQ